MFYLNYTLVKEFYGTIDAPDQIGPDRIYCDTGPGYARWLKLLQVRVMYKLNYTPEIQLRICLTHACVLA